MSIYCYFKFFKTKKIILSYQFFHNFSAVSGATDNHQSLLNSMKEEMSVRRQKIGSLSRQDSKQSVKSLIESIENVTKEKVKGGVTTSNSNSSICSLTTEKNGQNGGINNRENEANDWVDNVMSSNQVRVNIYCYRL